NGNRIFTFPLSVRAFTSTKATAHSRPLLKRLPHRRRQQTRPGYLGLNQGDLVYLAGTPVAFAAEIDRVLANIDHFWITIGIGAGEPIRVALSTHSRQNAAAGFDARMRVGRIASTWGELPATGLFKSACLDYHALEAASPIF